MIDGIVSNCFRRKLDAGAALDDLINAAFCRGYRAIELRQGCLGEYETSDRQPIADQLNSFPGRFPGMRFSVAIEFPFLSPADNGTDNGTDDGTFSAGKWAAAAVAAAMHPHLRLVDLATSNSELSAAFTFSAAVKRIVKLTRSMIEIDGLLSIEHSRQHWQHFRRVFEESRQQLGADSSRLRICFDPCNLLSAGEASAGEASAVEASDGENVNPAEITATLTPDELSMVHLKQQRAGELLSTVQEGDVDWRAVCAMLKQIGCRGPGLFEVAPHVNLWDNLEASRDYIREIGND